MLPIVANFVILSMAVAAESITITRSAIFGPFRSWCYGKNKFLGGLVSCPYCFSHWGSFFATWWFALRIVDLGLPIYDFLATSFAMVALATVWAYVIMRMTDHRLYVGPAALKMLKMVLERYGYYLEESLSDTTKHDWDVYHMLEHYIEKAKGD